MSRAGRRTVLLLLGRWRRMATAARTGTGIRRGAAGWPRTATGISVWGMLRGDGSRRNDGDVVSNEQNEQNARLYKPDAVADVSTDRPDGWATVRPTVRPDSVASMSNIGCRPAASAVVAAETRSWHCRRQRCRFGATVAAAAAAVSKVRRLVDWADRRDRERHWTVDLGSKHGLVSKPLID